MKREVRKMKAKTAYSRRLTEAEKERIIKQFLPFIKYTAQRLAWRLPPSLDVEDLQSAGIMGLLDALQRYREGVAKLGTFVEARIRGAMLDELRSVNWIPKSMQKKIKELKEAYASLENELGRPPEPEEVAEKLGITLDDYYKVAQSANMEFSYRYGPTAHRGGGSGEEKGDSTDSIPDPNYKPVSQVIEESMMKELLATHIENLPEKEKYVLALYYWEEMTMKEISQVLGLTEGRISQLHNQALLRLKVKLDL